MDRIEALKTITAQAASGDLVFPTGIDVALKIQRALDVPFLLLARKDTVENFGLAHASSPSRM